ncbi:MAG TPA: maltose alpha-D-glucosyltransferase [Stellaceae bacterium]|nr:maltose alpha-D-glucosyltransferase [Stellaceae bacterium]
MPDIRLDTQTAPIVADPLWYKDAIIYQLHVKAFFDTTADGIGDFQGLTRKLDYLADLGVTALWLLPFYPSPLKDDGYDIADYRNINPAYGTMGDFRAFVRAAHRLGLRVITELVVNHTSDQHPWFQRARRARPASHWRNFYVWSDTDQKFLDTRIIFLDAEKSNWAWDPVAQAYYWHRFYHHQPDLNFDNPLVERAVINVMRFWLDIGVDGMRLDAVPYLIEREGSINENLPETHGVLKRLRRALDERYSDRMLLAEANQWPEDVLQYFGAGDECHMAFNFPLMPRIFMAVATEDRHPITDIMRQTPDIPANCQWAVFLRNHDELTLEMVTDRERDYLWKHYAADKRMRLNLGIRRRLAPLMENDRRRMELLNGLMFSLPGTPVMYYGDEIGMGDNIFLGDRDGVRTPMQWSPDRNAGFSRADPAQLYLPPIMDAVYGYNSVNVEAQSRSPSSFLNWMKRLIAVRKARLAFGRGDLRFLYPSNRKVLAYLRSHGEETILCVFNLSRGSQAVELDLSGLKGRTPVELFGRTAFPQIGDLPYLLTISGHAFYWFLLDSSTIPERVPRASPPVPELMTVVLSDGGWSGPFNQHNRQLFESQVLPDYLPTQRWFAGKGRKIKGTTVSAAVMLPDGADRAGWPMMLIDVDFRDGEAQRYFLPLALTWEEEGSEQRNALLPCTLARARRGRHEGAVYDATEDRGFALAFAQAIGAASEIGGRGGRVVFERTAAFARVSLPPNPVVKRPDGEQSNSSILVEEYAVLKLYRHLAVGAQPEIEMTRFLTEVAHFANTPPLLGACRFIAENGEETELGVLFAYLRNQGSAWTQALNYLTRYLDEGLLMTPREPRPAEASAPLTPEATAHPIYLELAAQLGLRTAELHRALCPDFDVEPAFVPEPITPADLAQWRERATLAACTMLDSLARRRDTLPPSARGLAERLLERREMLLARYAELLPHSLDALKTRFHGDYHLGQVLVIQNDFSIIDFEGEPLRLPAERREKSSPLRDVAGMLRSYAYAATTAVRQMSDIQPAALPVLQAHAEEWCRQVTAAFLERYLGAMAGVPSLPADAAAGQALIEFFTLEKAVYEIDYELAQRPQWIALPLSGVLALLGNGADLDAA